MACQQEPDRPVVIFPEITEAGLRVLEECGRLAEVLRPDPGQMDVQDTASNQATSANSCGLSGSLIWTYTNPPRR
jgi:hypothetical protein